MEIVGAGNVSKDLKLDVLDVGWLIVFHEEVLVLSFEDGVGTSDDKQLDVRKDIVRNLITLCGLTGSHQSDQRSLKSFVDLSGKILVIFCQVKEYLDCTEHDRRAGMLESVFQQIHDVEHLFLALRVVLRGEVKDDTLAPLIEFLDPI